MNDIKNIDCKMAIVEDLFKEIKEKFRELESQDKDFENNRKIVNKTIDTILETIGKCDSIICDLNSLID